MGLPDSLCKRQCQVKVNSICGTKVVTLSSHKNYSRDKLTNNFSFLARALKIEYIGDLWRKPSLTQHKNL